MMFGLDVQDQEYPEYDPYMTRHLFGPPVLPVIAPAKASVVEESKSPEMI